MSVPTIVAGWTIGEFLGGGKSAKVFAATKGEQQAAIKIFNAELVDRFGKEIQLQRIQRELSLVGLHHPYLIQIYDGGECPDTGWLFITMELLRSPNLATVLSDVPREAMAILLAQVASAACFLESHGLAHRDIKPENIVVSSDFSSATLLDLGVIRPIANSNITDMEQRVFIGTLRYSSPEYLLRHEDDSIEGWRALTFYQLGAVLHDMIMKVPLFSEISEPYARLVQAVERDIPRLDAPDVSPGLLSLAKNALVKDPHLRLQLVSWKDFEVRPTSDLSIAKLKERIRQNTVRARDISFPDHRALEGVERIQKLSKITDEVQGMIRHECVSSDLLPPVLISDLPPSTEGTACFTVYLESLDLGHKVPTHILISLSLLDVQADVIILSASAVVSQQEQVEVEDFAPLVEQYRGAFERETVRRSILHMLLLALYQSQEVQMTTMGLATERHNLLLNSGVE